MIEAKVITGEEIAIDCTIIKAWCNVYRKQKSDKQARWGFLRKDGGKIIWIYGYKVHIIVDAKTDLPINTRNCKGKNEKEKKERRIKRLRKWYWKNHFQSYFLDPNSREFKDYYKRRGASERNHSNGKGEFQLDHLRWQGLEKATIHASLSLTARLAVALTAAQVGRKDLINPPKCFTA